MNAKMAERKPQRPREDRCTGCNLRWSEDKDEDEDEDEQVGPDDVCDTCGYQACESCVSDTSNGECTWVCLWRISK